MGEPPGGPDQPDTPDGIDKLLREIDAELHQPAKFKEPSAAERARKPRLRDRRKAERLRKPVPGPSSAPGPDHWRSGPAQPQRASSARGRASSARGRAWWARGRAWSLLIAVVVIGGLAAAGIELPKLALHKTPAAADSTPAKNGATPTSQPTTAGASSLPSPTLAAPFLGTPAQSYADGAAGILIPPAHSVGSYSAAQVEAAYRKTRRLLIAANLNAATLKGGTPNAFARLLVSKQRTQFQAGLDKTGTGSRGAPLSTRAWVMAFAPGTELVGSVIKVYGSMQAATGKDDGDTVLNIQTNYLFVYAVMEPGVPSSLVRIVAHAEGPVMFATWDDPGGPLEPWWDVGTGKAGAQCGSTDGYVHPQYPAASPGKVKPTGAPVNPYDQKAALPKGCRNTTGT
jgi:hypothetical protein